MTAKCYEVDKRCELFTSRPRVAGLQQQIESLFTIPLLNSCTSLDGEMIFMRVHKYWLDYDLAALALLIIGMAAVELLALMM